MVQWQCSNCGARLERDTPPEACPACHEKCEFVNTTCYTPDCEQDGIDKRIR